jgi:hypothetical protein
MPATPDSKARTRAFARVIGPFLVVVPSIVAARAPEMDAVAASFFEHAALVWLTGGLLLLGGLLIIAYHQVWSSPPAVFISLFGWILALRGVALLAVPHLIASGDAGAMIPFPAVRLGFGLLFMAGVWLIVVGWTAEPLANDP